MSLTGTVHVWRADNVQKVKRYLLTRAGGELNPKIMMYTLFFVDNKHKKGQSTERNM